MRLSSISPIAVGVRLPAYEPAGHGTGIVHIGIGAFHRAHQAVTTDDALAAQGGDWRIVGVSLRGTAAADALNPQDGRYTVVERGAKGSTARIIGSVSHVIAASREPGAAVATMADPATRIVSLTVTEKAYGIDRATGGIDRSHPAIAADLATPRRPTGVLGHIVEALRLRQEAGVPPFTVLCCDNLPENGTLVRSGAIAFAEALDPTLADHIANHVAFPCTMVDRITPAPTERTRADAAALTGCEDHAAVETEPFTQWVIEDRFPHGRPAWEAGGALFVESAAPYERMKLRMVNGPHSMIAYAGLMAGHPLVRDVLADGGFAALVRRQMMAAAATLKPLKGIDFSDYADSLIARFANPAIAHETYQIAMDGTEKLPQRIFGPVLDAMANGQDIRPFAFAVASWMRYSLGRKDDGTAYALRDPREAEIAAALSGASNAVEISGALHALPGLFPEALTNNVTWRRAVADCLTPMLDYGVAAAAEAEARLMLEPA
ncbi:MAG: mannitol dehydrogenase family protein [Rhodobiaceae bacterium]|nr:mannitol dehydrogenase family protein [Rhodobiaceae bacterium]